MRRGAMIGAAVCALLAGSGVYAQEESPKLPITKVVLYKDGVGYFERTGKVQGDETLSFRFKAADMSDLLKSMTLLDLSGGSIRTISYESTKTVDQQLGEYTFDLRAADGFPAVLDQMKGAEVVLSVAGKDVPGRVLSIEKRLETVDKAQTEIYILSVLMDGGAVKSYKLGEIDEVRFADPRLQAEMQNYLKTLFSRLRRDEKEVTILASGQGERSLLISYVREQPVWKVSYRIVMEKKEKPLLQAWAIVDNVSEEDWKNVSLSLVSGLPVSFVQDLYDPWYVKRPVVAPQGETAGAPVLFEAGAAQAEEEAAVAEPETRPRLARAFGGRAGAAPAAPMAMSAPPPPNMLSAMSRQVTDVAAREAGALFVYNIEAPVTIQRDHSALLPIANARVEGAPVSIYDESVRALNPMQAVRLKNTSGLTLEGGPVTVIQDNTYAGDALMDTLKPDEQRYVSYAVDLGTRVNTKLGSGAQDIYRVRIVRGTLYEDYKRQEWKTYSLANADAREKTVVIEYPVRQGWTLLQPEKPIEITPQHYRFELQLPARDKGPGQAELKVVEQMQGFTTYAVANISPERILFYVRQKYVDDATRNFLDKVAAMQADIAGLKTQLADAERQRTDIFTDQDRMRQNMTALRDTEAERDLRNRYVKQFSTDEDRLDELKTRVTDLTASIEKKQKDLDDLISGFTFETKQSK